MMVEVAPVGAGAHTPAAWLAAGIVREVVGDAATRVAGVRHDSRRVQPGDAFVAIAGERQDGSGFARDAVARGAAVVVSERALDVDVPVALVDDALAALASIARAVYGDPSRQLKAIGITGTNGKTTVAYLVEQALLALGQAPAVIGTVDFRGPFGTLPATHTTPMADDLMRLSRMAVDSGASHLVLEVSSHGLAMRRADGVEFAAVAFTNLSQDHLDYHGDLERYAAAKRRLFTELVSAAAVVNVDDAEGERIAAAYAGPCLTTSRGGRQGASLQALEVGGGRAGTKLRVHTPGGEVRIDSALLGAHNADNLLTALGCLLALDFAAPAAAKALSGATGAPGRMQRVPHPQDVLVFVDYAHTPDALDKAVLACAAMTDGRLIVVFGCGGDRDRAKRPLMGAAASAASASLIVTSDNPRGESPAAIIDDILPGVSGAGLPACGPAELIAGQRGYVVEPDRRAAIRHAIAAARAGDTVLIAGKGHERVQVIGEQRLPFDDVEEAQRAIAASASAPGGAQQGEQGS